MMPADKERKKKIKKYLEDESLAERISRYISPGIAGLCSYTTYIWFEYFVDNYNQLDSSIKAIGYCESGIMIGATVFWGLYGMLYTKARFDDFISSPYKGLQEAIRRHDLKYEIEHIIELESKVEEKLKTSPAKLGEYKRSYADFMEEAVKNYKGNKLILVTLYLLENLIGEHEEEEKETPICDEELLRPTLFGRILDKIFFDTRGNRERNLIKIYLPNENI